MDALKQEVLMALDYETLVEIINRLQPALRQNESSLLQRAGMMAEAETYEKLVRYCYGEVAEYLSIPNNLAIVLSDSNNIQPAFHAIVTSDDFNEIYSSEYRGFPHIIAMSVLAGSEALAANLATSVLESAPFQVRSYVDGLVDVYQQYMQDALDYGHSGR